MMPTKAELTEAFNAAATEVLGELPEGLTEQSGIRADVGADSLDMLEIVLIIEDRFDATFAEDEFAEVVTVGDALDRLALLLDAR